MNISDGGVQIAYNIIGGIIVSGFALLLQWLYRKLNARRFNQIFQDAEGAFHLVYKSMKPPEGTIFLAEESKRSRAVSRTTNVSLVTSCAEARGIGYMVYVFGENIGKSPFVVSQADVDQNMNLSFISIGGPTNLKTKESYGKSS